MDPDLCCDCLKEPPTMEFVWPDESVKMWCCDTCWEEHVEEGLWKSLQTLGVTKRAREQAE